MALELKNRSQFESLLKNYEPSSQSKTVLKNLKLVLLMGVSASGRDSIIRELVKTGEYFDVVTDTTRSPRINNGSLEQNGVEYFFQSEEDMLVGLKDGIYIAPAIIHDQQVSAVSVRELQNAKLQNKIAVIDVQTDGVDAILKDKSDTVCIFVMPPSYSEWMRRLHARSSLSHTEIARRLRSAQYELEHLSKDHYKVVVNDDLAEAVNQIQAIVAHNDNSEASSIQQFSLSDFQKPIADHLADV